jgi:phage shock protein A
MVQRQSITSTDPDFEIAEEKIRMEIDKATSHIKKLKARRDSLPARVTVADAQKGQEMVKLSTETQTPNQRFENGRVPDGERPG